MQATHVRTKGSRTSAHTWMFPYCRACLEHVNRARRFRWRVQTAGWITFIIFAAIGIILQLWFVFLPIAVVIGLIVSWVAHRRFMATVRQGLQPTCACMGPAVRFDGFYGSVQTFSFANAEFAAAFAQANAKKVV